MIEQQGSVIAVESGLASIRIGGVSGCPACDAGNGCGAGVFGRLLRRKPLVLRLTNSLDARTGQAVMVGIPERDFLRLLLKLYLIPLLAGLAGAALGHHLVALGFTHPVLRDVGALGGAVWFGGLALWVTRSETSGFVGDLRVTLLRIAPMAPAAGSCSLPGTGAGQIN